MSFKGLPENNQNEKNHISAFFFLKNEVKMSVTLIISFWTLGFSAVAEAIVL